LPKAIQGVDAVIHLTAAKSGDFYTNRALEGQSEAIRPALDSERQIS
jgi:hypothetical protein